MTITMTPDEAREAIQQGKATPGMLVNGGLRFSSYDKGAPLTRLPNDLQVRGELALYNCQELRSLPKGLRCHSLHISNSLLRELASDLQVRSSLTLDGCPYLKSLPYNLKVPRMTLTGCKSITWLPNGLQVAEYLQLGDCEHLEYLPAQLKVRILVLSEGMNIRTLPTDMQITSALSVQRCTTLESVPPLTVETLNLAGCTALKELPDGLQVRYLDISNCRALERWPSSGLPGLRRLRMAGCVSLRSLPPGLRQLDELDLRDCVSIETPPEYLRITRWLDIGGLPWQALPLSSRGFRLRWRGIPLSGRIIFHPETLTVDEVLAESNAEVRRLMLEHMEFERFFREAKAEAYNEDTDPGGTRKLLVVKLQHDEPLVCLAVQDPSTGRQYVIRVPPWMRTCHQAAAWIAGFDDPDEYHPVAEA